ncbi:TetR/AcrR family transcriptional regulator [Primorskyibacter sp. S187A]|uniref:TetR/AcrR family transcriptional regulator n=1 Tax=Primorskyibacter sp. S187A TaxID=3415130 RepID=UPI003C7CC6F5
MTQNTRTALLDNAEILVRQRGFDGFSYADLAAAIGIRKASIHYHFPTKAALSLALMERYHAGMEATCATIDAHENRASDRLLSLIAHYRDALSTGGLVCLCVSLSASPASLSTAVLDSIVAFREMVLAWLRKTYALALEDGSIRDASDVSQEAHATLAMLEGAHLAARVTSDPAAFDHSVAILKMRCCTPD